MTNYGACLNPAIAFGITMAALYTDGAHSLTNVWLYPTMPFAGGLLAFLFYELVYKKTQKMLRQDHRDEEGVLGVDELESDKEIISEAAVDVN